MTFQKAVGPWGYLAKSSTDELMKLVHRIASSRITDDVSISLCWAAIQLFLYDLAVSSHQKSGSAPDKREMDTLWNELVSSSGNSLYRLETCLDGKDNSKMNTENNNGFITQSSISIDHSASREIIDYFAGQSFFHDARVMRK